MGCEQFYPLSGSLNTVMYSEQVIRFCRKYS